METSFKCLLTLLLLLGLPAVVQAQFNYTTNNGAITITYPNCLGGAVTIPSTINGLPVTAIGTNAFEFCGSLTNVIIPNSVTSIGSVAFWSCTSLASITIPNSTTTIGVDAFKNCTNLTMVTLGAEVTSIRDYAFWSCTSLTGVYMKGNAPSLGLYAFYRDSATVYYLPGTTGWSNFSANTGLSTVLWNPQVQSGASFGVRTNRFGFTITGTNGLIVVVEAHTNLANPVWYPLQTNTLTGGSSYFSDPRWTNYTRRFYRLNMP